MRTAVLLVPPERPAAVASLLERVATVGFDGVAFAALDEGHLRPAATVLGETGLEPVAVQAPHDRLLAERREVVRELSTIGCERVVVPPLHEAHVEAEGGVARMATRLSVLGGRLGTAGRTLCYRNGSHEFRPVDGDAAADRVQDAYDLLVERAGDGLAFELDVGGAVAGGRDPVALLERLDGRVPLVQVRDVGPGGEPVELGDGTVDVAAVVAASREAGAEWLVYGGPAVGHSDGSLTRAAEVLAGALE